MIPVRVDGGRVPSTRATDRVLELPAGHPLIGARCPGCDEPFTAGAPIRLVLVAVPDPGQQAKAAAGRPYTGAAVAVHHDCVGVTSVDGGRVAELEADVARLRGLLQQANAQVTHAREQAEWGQR